MYQVVASILSHTVPVIYQGTDYHLVSLQAPAIARAAMPGQYLMLKCGEEHTLRRPLSIHSANPIEGTLELLFTPLGAGTRWLAARKEGDIIDTLGPLGNGFSLEHVQNPILIIAGGIGVAPMKYLAAAAIKTRRKVTLLLGAKTAKGLYPTDMLPSKIELIEVTEDGSRGNRGMVTSLIANHISKSDQVFACGPKAMYEEIYRQQKKYKWSQEIQVSLEIRMGCGFGVCYGCSIKTRQGLKKVCRDGPVFNIKDIIWQEVNL